MLVCNCGATPTHFVKQFLDRSKIMGVAYNTEVNMVPIEISAKYWNLYMQPPSMLHNKFKFKQAQYLPSL